MLGPPGALAWPDEAPSQTCIAGPMAETFFVAEHLSEDWASRLPQTGKAGVTVAHRLGTWTVKSDRCGGFSTLPFISW